MEKGIITMFVSEKRVLNRESICDYIFDIGVIILFTFAINLMYSNVLFAVGRIISWRTIPISFTFALILLIVINPPRTSVGLAWEITSLIVLFCIVTWTIGKFYDYSWDGNSYHKLAVDLLKNGWNPIRELPRLEVYEAAPSVFDIKWCESYCKATWIFAAGIYAMTGNVESGKVYTALGMICVFCISYYFFRKKDMSCLTTVLLSVCLALNPIAVQQIFTYYLDGFLHLILEVLILSLIMYCDKEKFDHSVSSALVFSAMIVCGNSKYTGLLFGGVFCAVFFAAFCLENRRESEWMKKSFKSLVYFAALAFTTVFLAGYSTYITNYLRHGSIIYPLSVSNHDNIILANTPFLEENHVSNLLLSLFSKTDNMTLASNRSIELKIPFTVDWEYESEYIVLPDARLGGFGVLFSGVLLCAIVTLVVYTILAQKDAQFYKVIAILATCFSLTFIIKESWWARYAPYIYITVIVAIYLLLRGRHILIRSLGVIIATILLVNNAIPLMYTIEYYDKSCDTREEIRGLKSDRVIEVFNGGFEGVYANLRDCGVFYVVNNALEKQQNVNTLDYMDTVWRYK